MSPLRAHRRFNVLINLQKVQKTVDIICQQVYYSKCSAENPPDKINEKEANTMTNNNFSVTFAWANSASGSSAAFCGAWRSALFTGDHV